MQVLSRRSLPVPNKNIWTGPSSFYQRCPGREGLRKVSFLWNRIWMLSCWEKLPNKGMRMWGQGSGRKVPSDREQGLCQSPRVQGDHELHLTSSEYILSCLTSDVFIGIILFSDLLDCNTVTFNTFRRKIMKFRLFYNCPEPQWSNNWLCQNLIPCF